MEPTATRRGPRIALIHALAKSVQPVHAAFAAHWSDATFFDLLDTSLARDLASAGQLDDTMIGRFLTLGRYAESTQGDGGKTAAILFTCSAFGPAIDSVKAAVSVPVLRPNEAAFDAAITRGGAVGLLVTFPPSLPALQKELRHMAAERGVEIGISGRVVEGALAALEQGDGSMHDRLVAEAAATISGPGSLVLGQFSMARAAAAIAPLADRQVLTTPASAVLKLRSLLG